jgi:hypothetical protein
MSCGFAEHAGVNAARDIAARGAAGWAAVMQPDTAIDVVEGAAAVP